jgi:hypothetical protein
MARSPVVFSSTIMVPLLAWAALAAEGRETPPAALDLLLLVLAAAAHCPYLSQSPSITLEPSAAVAAAAAAAGKGIKMSQMENLVLYICWLVAVAVAVAPVLLLTPLVDCPAMWHRATQTSKARRAVPERSAALAAVEVEA